jgi:CysZ protein
LDGAKAPWQGLWFLFTTPESWPFAAVPVTVALTIFGFLSYLSVSFLPAAVQRALPPGEAWYTRLGSGLLAVLATIAAIVAAFLLGMVLAQPLSGPALERLVRLRERELGIRERPSTSFLMDAWRSLRSALLGTLALPVLLGLTLVELFVPGSSVVILPLKILVTGVFVAWDILDYPLSVRGYRLRDRLRFLAAHKGACLGFGVSLAVVLLVPCMQLLLLPGAVVGATALRHRMVEVEATGS